MKKRIYKLTRDKLVSAVEDFGYKVTNQSTDGTYKLLRTPDGESTDYWIFANRIEHRGEKRDGFSYCSYFSYKDCFMLIEDNALSIIVKNIKHHGVFIILFNYSSKEASTKGGERCQ